MTAATKSVAKFNPNQFADAIRSSAIRIFESVQDTVEKTQEEGRIVLSKQVLKSAHRANDLSKALIVLSEKIAPSAKPKAKAKAKAKARAKAAPNAKTKPQAVKAVAKPRARKAAGVAAE